MIEPANGVLQLTLADGGGSYDERAILDSLSDGLEFFGLGKQRCSANRGTRLSESQFIRIHDAEMKKAEIAHSASGGTDVEGVARRYKNDAQEVGFWVG